MPKMSPNAGASRKQALYTGLEDEAKDVDPYSWKYFYKLSKDRKAARDEETGSMNSNTRLFSQGPLTTEAKVASIGIQSSTRTPVIQMIDKAKKIQLSQSSLSSRLTCQKGSYKSISMIIGDARISQQQKSRVANGLKQVNSEALLQKSRLWEQNAQ